jgi:hypothetical protein
MNLETLQPALVTLFSSLASDDMLRPLADGTVSWFGRQVPFIGDDTQAGIYLRITNVSSYGKPASRYTEVSRTEDRINDQGALETFEEVVLANQRDEQKKMTLQVQVCSDEHTDSTCALAWAHRIADNLRDPSVRRYLRLLGLSVIRVHDLIATERTVDGRSLSVGSLDITLQVGHTVQGLDMLPIDSIGGTGSILGSGATGAFFVPFSASKD